MKFTIIGGVNKEV